MVLIAGPDHKDKIAIQRKLLGVGIISECAPLRELPLLLEERKSVHAVLFVAEKPSAAILAIFEYFRKKHPNLTQCLIRTSDRYQGEINTPFDLILPIETKAQAVFEKLALSIIARKGVNPTDRIAGALRYRHEEHSFSLVLTHMTFSDSYTALLLRLMDVYPEGTDRDDLMRVAFLPLGRKSRTNVSHAVAAINRKVAALGHKPLVEFSNEKGYFLR